jgi:hypothetical protein
VNAVSTELVRKLRPDESPLIAARDELIRRGFEPPVISDEWWLDVVEASNRMSNSGAYVPEEVVWGTWTFPLPHEKTYGAERGKYLAWTALQLDWSAHAEQEKICAVTHPEVIHDFIRRFSGLKEICLSNPRHVACYAPQLTIPQFSGFLAPAFDDAMNASIEHNKRLVSPRREFDEEWCLRHPAHGGYQSSEISHNYFSGQMFAPKADGYEGFEHVVWLLSPHSHWLPEDVREILIQGSLCSPLWLAGSSSYFDNDNALLHAIQQASAPSKFKFTKRIRQSLDQMVEQALVTLKLDSNAQEISDLFVRLKFAENYLHLMSERRRRKSTN